MKFLIFTDNHFCERYSLISRYGSKYSIRLENQLESINWVEQLAVDEKCDGVICAGDFFDKATLTDQELTALRDIKWNNLPHYFLVGNHESEEGNLQYSSTKALESDSRRVIWEPTVMDLGASELAFLPYTTESDRKPLNEVFEPMKKPRILISHNDICGLHYGPVVTKTGFTIEDLEGNSTLCINGHLHNGQDVTPRIINLGNLTGKDLGENAEIYLHRVIILDTDTLKIDYRENPYAFNFYKLDILEEADLEKLTNLKQNAVVSIKCLDSLVAKAKEIIDKNKNIVETRVVTVKPVFSDGSTEYDLSDLTMDHLARFYEICKEKIENTDVLDQELAEVLK